MHLYGVQCPSWWIMMSVRASLGVQCTKWLSSDTPDGCPGPLCQMVWKSATLSTNSGKPRSHWSVCCTTLPRTTAPVEVRVWVQKPRDERRLRRGGRPLGLQGGAPRARGQRPERGGGGGLPLALMGCLDSVRPPPPGPPATHAPVSPQKKKKHPTLSGFPEPWPVRGHWWKVKFIVICTLSPGGGPLLRIPADPHITCRGWSWNPRDLRGSTFPAHRSPPIPTSCAVNVQLHAVYRGPRAGPWRVRGRGEPPEPAYQLCPCPSLYPPPFPVALSSLDAAKWRRSEDQKLQNGAEGAGK
eukprot:gene15009-biopygen3640